MGTEIVDEARVDKTFFDSLVALPEGSQLRSCIQCGTCGGACPVAPYLVHTPRRIIAMARAGLKHEVLTSLTPWVCASCYQCQVWCPQEVAITEVMYAIKRRAISEGLGPDDADSDRFLKLFVAGIRRRGRAHETGLLLRYMTLRHPFALLKRAPLGMRLMARGRMPLLGHRIGGVDGLQRIVDRALALDRGEP